MTTMIPTPTTNLSQLPGFCLQSYLDGMATRLQAHGVVVANEDGLLVAGSGEASELDALAAVSAFPSFTDRLGMDTPVHAHSACFGGITLHLAVAGQTAPSPAEASAVLKKVLS